MERSAAKNLERGLFFLQKRTGYHFNDPSLLALAFTSRSNEKSHSPSSNNERLEFLGDAALDLVVGNDLYHEYPNADEGFMTIERANLVCGQNLTAWGYEAGFDKLLQVGDEVDVSASMVEDAVESVAGAFFLDGGLEAVRALVQSFPDYPDQGTGFDSRRHLERNCTFLRLGTPKYVTMRRRTNGKTIFECKISLDKVSVGTGIGGNKEESERNAARDAMCRLNHTSNDERKKRAAVVRARYRRLISQRVQKTSLSNTLTMSDAEKINDISSPSRRNTKAAIKSRSKLLRRRGVLHNGISKETVSPSASVLKGLDLSALYGRSAVVEKLSSIAEAFSLGKMEYVDLQPVTTGGTLYFVQLKINGDVVTSASGRTKDIAKRNAAWKALQLIAVEPLGYVNTLDADMPDLRARLENAFIESLKKSGADEPQIEIYEKNGVFSAKVFSGEKLLVEVSLSSEDDARLMSILKVSTQLRLWKDIQKKLGILSILPWELDNWRPDLALKIYSRVSRIAPIEVISLADAKSKRKKTDINEMPDNRKNSVIQPYYKVGLFIQGYIAAFVSLPSKKLSAMWLSLLILDRACRKRPITPVSFKAKARENDNKEPNVKAAYVGEQPKLPKIEHTVRKTVKVSLKDRFKSLLRWIEDYYVN